MRNKDESRSREHSPLMHHRTTGLAPDPAQGDTQGSRNHRTLMYTCHTCGGWRGVTAGAGRQQQGCSRRGRRARGQLRGRPPAPAACSAAAAAAGERAQSPPGHRRQRSGAQPSSPGAPCARSTAFALGRGDESIIPLFCCQVVGFTNSSVTLPQTTRFYFISLVSMISYLIHFLFLKVVTLSKA